MRHAVRTLALVLVAVPQLNCVAKVQAHTALREGHKLYKEESFRKAIDEYQVVLEKDPGNLEATFYLGSSYHQLFRPGKDETNKNLDEAIKNYKAVLAATPAADDPKYPTLQRNSRSALIAIYADPPHQDFDVAMKYATDLTKDDPKNQANLFAMAGLYEKFGKVNEAEEAYKSAVAANPKDQKACGALAGFYNKTLWDEKGVPVTPGDTKTTAVGRFDDAVNQLKLCAELDPRDPKGYYTVATFYWDKTYRGGITDEGRKKQLADEGMLFVDKALEIKNDFVEALIYKGLLLREQAKLTRNPAQRNSMLEEAVILQKRALELKKQQENEAAEKAKAAAAAVASN